MADPIPPNDHDLPSAVPDARRRVRLPYEWLLPIIVILAGAFVAVREKLAEGTSIEITFHTADDLEPNKTKISYKAVEIGEVKGIRVSKDRKDVIVEDLETFHDGESVRTSESPSDAIDAKE